MPLAKEKLEKAAFILKTIGHPTRLAIIEILNESDEVPVNELCSRLNCEQSLVSHHLSNMRLKGLLKIRKEGTMIYYSLKEKHLAEIIECVQKCECYM